MKLWQRRKEILIKKVFHLRHKENIEETKEVLRKLGRGHRNRVKKDVELAESDGNTMAQSRKRE